MKFLKNVLLFFCVFLLNSNYIIFAENEKNVIETINQLSVKDKKGFSSFDYSTVLNIGVKNSNEILDIFIDPLCEECSNLFKIQGNYLINSLNEKKYRFRFHLMNINDKYSYSGNYSTRINKIMRCTESYYSNYSKKSFPYSKTIFSFLLEIYSTTLMPKINGKSDLNNSKILSLLTRFAITNNWLQKNQSQFFEKKVLNCTKQKQISVTIKNKSKLSFKQLNEISGADRFNIPTLLYAGEIIDNPTSEYFLN